jgi:ComF family protein
MRLKPMWACVPCVICRSLNTALVCVDCWRCFGPQASHNLWYGSHDQPPQPLTDDPRPARLQGVSVTLAAVDYVFPWQGLIRRFKTFDGPALGAALAPLLVHAVRRHRPLGSKVIAQADKGSPADVNAILALPSTTERWRQRGHNPAWSLAQPVARALGLPVWGDVLTRPAIAAHQRGLSRSQRQINIQGTFCVSSAHAHRIRGRVVAVIDDVTTTGATLDEAAHVLRAAGARDVQGWVLARTPKHALASTAASAQA